VAEYIIRVSITRSARGEGDEPVVALALAESVHPTASPKEEAIKRVLKNVTDHAHRILNEEGINV
jgi:cell division septum initiation protein DivIVA